MYPVKVMTLNCASFKAWWAVRVVILAARVLFRAPDVLTCVELYATRRGRLSKRLARRYVLAGTYRGKVIYVRKGIPIHKGTLLRLNLGNGKHALAVRLVHPKTGAQFVVVVAHLSWQIGYDGRREAQTHRLIGRVRQHFPDLPTVYTGDWNSSIRKGRRKRDAVGSVFSARGVIEAFTTARVHRHEEFNSANRYLRHAPTSGVHLDRMFGDGVEFGTWVLDVYPPAKRRPLYGADHFGLVCTVLIPTP